jgi:hypothetical protein
VNSSNQENNNKLFIKNRIASDDKQIKILNKSTKQQQNDSILLNDFDRQHYSRRSKRYVRQFKSSESVSTTTNSSASTCTSSQLNKLLLMNSANINNNNRCKLNTIMINDNVGGVINNLLLDDSLNSSDFWNLCSNNKTKGNLSLS